MISVKNVTKSFGNRMLFKDIDFHVNEYDKIGLIGQNGVGKTTLLKIIEDDNLATDGEVIKLKHTFGFLSQSIDLNENNTINQELDTLKSQIKNIEQQMNDLLNADDFAINQLKIKEYGELESKYTALDGYKINAKMDKIMAQFGFKNYLYKKKISQLSGGEKTRFALVKIIIANPDYLILDEPTNHLDINTIEWLEEYLRTKVKGLILISHDRFFLQRVCNKIIEIENYQATVYKMRYEQYLVEKQLRLDYQTNRYEKQLKEIEKLKEFITKNNKKPSKIGQVNDRKSKLEQLQKIEKPVIVNQKINFVLKSIKLKTAFYVDFVNADIGYQKPLIKDLTFRIYGGDKLGILGDNGLGKSTIVKTILKIIKPLGGKVIVHPSLNIGYYQQEQTNLDMRLNVYQTIEQLIDEATKTAIRKYLAKFLFVGDEVFKPVTALSGGEKVRLMLAVLTLKKYDLLIMDEPTNHLDLESKSQLEMALKNYRGTLIIISHDRYLIDKVVDKVLVVHQNKNYQVYEGTYQQYLANKKQVIVQKQNKTKHKKIIVPKTIIRIEKQIKKLERQKNTYNELVQQQIVYSDWQKLGKYQELINQVDEQLEELYEQFFKESDV